MDRRVCDPLEVWLQSLLPVVELVTRLLALQLSVSLLVSGTPAIRHPSPEKSLEKYCLVPLVNFYCRRPISPFVWKRSSWLPSMLPAVSISCPFVQETNEPWQQLQQWPFSSTLVPWSAFWPSPLSHPGLGSRSEPCLSCHA